MGEYRNILVHCLINMGDVVLATSAVALLKQSEPEAKITMMVKPAAAAIVQNNPLIDEVIVFDYAPKKTSLRKTVQFLQLIRSKKFDLSISLDGKSRPAYLVYFAGIPRRIAPANLFSGKSHLLRLATDIVELPNCRSLHQTQVLQGVIRGFTGQQGTAKPVMARILPENHRVADDLLAELPPKRLRIALCVKGTFPLKDWPKARFVQLIDQLSVRYDASFFVIGAPTDKDYAELIIQETTPPVANFCGRTRIMDLAALLTKADLFITVDTGAMHIGATTGVPLVALFGCTSPLHFAPCSDQATVIAHTLPCNPCHYPADGCPHEFECMTSITVAEVVSAAEGQLNRLIKDENHGK